MKTLLTALLMIPLFGYSQQLKIKKDQSGIVGFGVRTTISTFNGGDFGNNGTGVGAQYRVQIANRINSEWFFDYITANVEDFGSREDYHIGVSIMKYFTDEPSPVIKPYIVVGYCFDYTEVSANSDSGLKIDKLSAAIQGGGGFHLNLTERVDLSFVSQYMIHLGEDIHAHQEPDGSIEFEREKGSGLEGHLLFHIGANIKIADLWGSES